MYVCGRFGEWRRAIPDNPTATLIELIEQRAMPSIEQ